MWARREKEAALIIERFFINVKYEVEAEVVDIKVEQTEVVATLVASVVAAARDAVVVAEAEAVEASVEVGAMMEEV